VSSSIQTQINTLNTNLGDKSLLPYSNNSTNYNIQQLKANLISSISRSGTTFTAKNSAGTSLFTFTQQDNNTTYSAATTASQGLMSAADKTKLNGIASSAKNITTKTFILDNKTIEKGGTEGFSTSVAYSGWTPIGIIGIDLANASSSGQGVTYISLHHYWLSGTTAYCTLRFNEASTGFT